MIRRVVILEEMFKDVATRQERLVLDGLYAKNLKGNAVVFMLKVIRKQWNIFTGKTGNSEEIKQRKSIKINYNGTHRLIARA